MSRERSTGVESLSGGKLVGTAGRPEGETVLEGPQSTNWRML
jgi:hypothetical protein